MIAPEGTKQTHPVEPIGQPRRFDMEVLVGYILLVGVLLSVSLILLGVGWHWVATGRLGLDYSIKGMNFLHFMASVFSRAIHGGFDSTLVTNLGIVTLLLTPYVRVFASMIYFAFAQRNWKYTLFTAFVFAVLTYSLLFR